MADDESRSPPHDVTTSETFALLAYIIHMNLKYIVVMMTRRGTIASTLATTLNMCHAAEHCDRPVGVDSGHERLRVIF